jgi:hypothetical protein
MTKFEFVTYVSLFAAAFMAGWYCPLPRRKKK